MGYPAMTPLSSASRMPSAVGLMNSFGNGATDDAIFELVALNRAVTVRAGSSHDRIDPCRQSDERNAPQLALPSA